MPNTKHMDQKIKDTLFELKKAIHDEIIWCENNNDNILIRDIGGSKEIFIKGLKQALNIISAHLLPKIEICPFCQIGKGRLYLNFDYVYCPSCGSRGQTFDGHPYDAIASWNYLSKLSQNTNDIKEQEGISSDGSPH